MAEPVWSQAQGILAPDSFTAELLNGAKVYVCCSPPAEPDAEVHTVLGCQPACCWRRCFAGAAVRCTLRVAVTGPQNLAANPQGGGWEWGWRRAGPVTELRTKVTLSMTTSSLMEVIVEPLWVGSIARTCMLVRPPQNLGAVTSMTRWHYCARR